MVRVLTLCLVLVLAIVPEARAEDVATLELWDGRVVVGRLLAETDTTWVLADTEGLAVVVYKSDVASVQLRPEGQDSPLALPAEASADPTMQKTDAASPSGTQMRVIPPPPALELAREVSPRPLWGLGSHAAVGARVAPLDLSNWNPLGWEEFALGASGAPGMLTFDLGTVEFRYYQDRRRSLDIFLDVIDLVVVPASLIGRPQPFTVSLGLMRHGRSPISDIASFVIAPGTGLRIEGTPQGTVWITPYSVNRVGFDLHPRSRAVDIGIYARFELGFAIGIPVAFTTVAAALFEVTFTINKMRR